MFKEKYIDSIYNLVEFPSNCKNLNFGNENEINHIVLERLKRNAVKNSEKSKVKCSKVNYEVRSLVLIKNTVLSDKSKKYCKKFAPKYKGPYVATKILKENFFQIKHVQTGELKMINWVLIKRFWPSEQ